MDEQISFFMDVTSTEDPVLAQQFLEMSGGDIESAVSLYFEHGPSITANAGSSSAAAIAQRFQQSIYQEDAREEEVRRPIAPVHDQLVSGMMYPRRSGVQDMIGRAEVGIFNQLGHDDDGRFEMSDGDQHYGDNNIDDDDEDYEIIDDDDDDDQRRQERVRSRDTRTSTQRRLANLFRPPWDIISKLDLESAKVEARKDRKWILVNIQDMSDFRCQCLNRDFWSSRQIKDLVRENFIFLQYHHDSPNGEYYRNMYPFSEYPHIAILDPMTLERLKMWDTNPQIHKWIEQVLDFMLRFSLDKEKKNPIVQHKTPVNVDAMSEEQQINFAMQKSLGTSDQNHPIALDSDPEEEESGKDKKLVDQAEPTNPLNNIQAVDHPDPDTSVDVKLTTRIQIRSGMDGKRIVKKFMLDDPVLKLYEYVKFAFKDSIGDKAFKLTLQRGDLIDKGLEISIDDAGLKNASVLLELIDTDD
ncbi:hypothetical protein CANARDRAFT_178814, partial [[Candida] arabinofermentans NRRL YB-2248]